MAIVCAIAVNVQNFKNILGTYRNVVVPPMYAIQ